MIWMTRGVSCPGTAAGSSGWCRGGDGSWADLRYPEAVLPGGMVPVQGAASRGDGTALQTMAPILLKAVNRIALAAAWGTEFVPPLAAKRSTGSGR